MGGTGLDLKRLFYWAAIALSTQAGACGSDEVTKHRSGDQSAGTGGANAGGAAATSGGSSTSLGGDTDSVTGGLPGDGAGVGGEPTHSSAGEGNDSTGGADPGEGGAPAGGGSGEAMGGNVATGGRAGSGAGGSGDTSSTGGSAGEGGAGTSCDAPSDCGDANTLICDPEVARCGGFECGPSTACSTGKICLTQEAKAPGGACYSSCTPFTNECGSGRQCVSLALDNSEGACFSRGIGTETCDAVSAISTGCSGEGQICYDHSCVSLCDAFAPAPGCRSSDRCDWGGVCRQIEGDPAAIGQACAADAVGLPCHDDRRAWRGLCLASDADVTCYGACRNSQECPANQSCVPVSGSQLPGIGVCVPHTECEGGGTEYASCAACQDAAGEGCCADALSACALSSECSALVDCLNACASDDGACSAACTDANQAGRALLESVFECLFGSGDPDFVGACGTVCPAT
jgi:hypothetical protein